MRPGANIAKLLHRAVILASMAAVMAFITSCAKKQPAAAGEPYTYDFFAADTFINLKVYGVDDPEALCKKVEQQTAELERVFSRHIEGSEVSKINAAPEGEYKVSDELAAVLDAALELAKATGGAYDPTIAPLVSLWNIGSGNERVPPQPEIDAARAKVRYENLALDGNTLIKLKSYAELDLGGSGKGYMLGKAIETMAAAGGYGVVSYGGNVGVYGKKPSGDPWRIGIKHPRKESATLGYVEVESGFVAVSGDYERYFIAEDGTRYCHILDPATGWPARNGVICVAVWTENAVRGDILSTALFVMGESEGLRFCEENGIAALFMTESGISQSPEMEKIFRKAS